MGGVGEVGAVNRQQTCFPSLSPTCVSALGAELEHRGQQRPLSAHFRLPAPGKLLEALVAQLRDLVRVHHG